MTELLNNAPSYALKDISANEVNALINQVIEKNKNNMEELSELTLECTALLKSAQNKSNALSEQGIFKRLIGDVKGKNIKIQNAILNDTTNSLYAAQTVINKVMLECTTNRALIIALNDRVNAMYREFKDNQNYLLEQVTMLREVFVASYADQNLMPPEELLLLKEPSVEHSNSGCLTTSKETGSDHVLGSGEGSNTSHEIKKESDNLVEDPKLKRKLRALRKDGYTDEDIEKEFGKLYIGLRTTNSYTTRRLKFHPPKYEPKGLIGNKARYNKELKLFDSRKKKIEKFLNSKYRENYIIDKEWIYFINIDIYNRGLFRMRLDASEPEELLFKDVNTLSSIYINDGMISFTDSKYNKIKIRVPN